MNPGTKTAVSTTPRTDALKGVPMTRYDSDEFARTLERELHAERAECLKRGEEIVRLENLIKQNRSPERIAEVTIPPSKTVEPDSSI